MSDCTSCTHAAWSRTPTGRIKRKEYGRCTAPASDLLRVVPACEEVKIHRYVIWPDDPHKDCPTWQPIP